MVTISSCDPVCRAVFPRLWLGEAHFEHQNLTISPASLIAMSSYLLCCWSMFELKKHIAIVGPRAIAGTTCPEIGFFVWTLLSQFCPDGNLSSIFKDL